MKGGDLDSEEASLIGGYQVNVGHCQLLQKTTVANSGVVIIPYGFSLICGWGPLRVLIPV